MHIYFTMGVLRAIAQKKRGLYAYFVLKKKKRKYRIYVKGKDCTPHCYQPITLPLG